jgi:hypothetical protein
MTRQLAVLTVVAAALFTGLASAASAALIHVRVEGKTTTIFGAAEPRALAVTALDALEAASIGGEFYYHLATSSFGDYVDRVGRFAGSSDSGWVFKVNGVSPPVGADKVTLADGDVVVWYYALFGPTGGPSTLQLSTAPGGCYGVKALDDAGKAAVPADAKLVVDGRSVETKGGVGCPGAHRGQVRAVVPGAVRSNSLR